MVAAAAEEEEEEAADLLTINKRIPTGKDRKGGVQEGRRMVIVYPITLQREPGLSLKKSSAVAALVFHLLLCLLQHSCLRTSAEEISWKPVR